MPTYAENAADRERKERRAVTDKQMAAQHALFDLQAKDNRMKYERPSFIVVTASDAYREGWDRIFNKPVVTPPIAEEGVCDGGRRRTDSENSNNS
jgi:hypothetical protein